MLPIIFSAEFAAIALTCNLLRHDRRDQDCVPAIAIIVGVHFLPLAEVFKFRLYHFVGARSALFEQVSLGDSRFGATSSGFGIEPRNNPLGGVHCPGSAGQSISR